MLKSTLLHYNNVDISPYSRLTAFLKEKSVGFESKKFKVFSAEEINRFLAEAQDEHYLAMKVGELQAQKNYFAKTKSFRRNFPCFLCLRFPNNFLHFIPDYFGVRRDWWM